MYFIIFHFEVFLLLILDEIMGPKKATSGTKLPNPSSSKTVPTKTKTTGKTVAQKKGAPVKPGAKVTKG